MKFNNVGLALSMALKFQTSVAKGLKIKVYVRRRYKGKKLVQKDGGGGRGRGFLPPHSFPLLILDRVNNYQHSSGCELLKYSYISQYCTTAMNMSIFSICS